MKIFWCFCPAFLHAGGRQCISDSRKESCIKSAHNRNGGQWGSPESRHLMVVLSVFFLNEMVSMRLIRLSFKRRVIIEVGSAAREGIGLELGKTT